MKNAREIIDNIERYCKARSIRLTSKRKQLLISLLESGKALSAYELSEQYEAQFKEAMPVMTVYRVMDFLEEHHLVHRLLTTKKYVACSHIGCDHTHEVPQFLICNQCNAVEEVSIKKTIVDALQEQIDRSHFQLVSPQFELNCVCHSCAEPTA